MMEYTNITFTNNIFHYQVIVLEAHKDDNIFPYCTFQYTASINQQYNFSESITHHTINFDGNNYATKNDFVHHTNNIYDFLTHCNWLPMATFEGYDPGYINQQII